MITTRHAPSPSSPVLQAEQAVAPGFPSRPTEEAIVGILAEHRWKHLVQIGQLLPSWYPEQAHVPYIKISTCDERTREMYRYAHHVAQIIIVVVTGVPPELAGPEAYEGVGISI